MGVEDLLSAWLDFEVEISLKIFDCIFVFKVCKVIVKKKLLRRLLYARDLSSFFM
jgi:hypothetical protein